MLRRRRVHVVFIAMSVCQQLAAAIELLTHRHGNENHVYTFSLTFWGYYIHEKSDWSVETH